MAESIAQQFDDLIRCMKLLSDPSERKFLEYLELESHCRCRELEDEVHRLTEQLNQAHKTSKNLEMKLKNARHILDQEKGRRKAAELEKNELAVQIFQAIEMLGQGQVNKTKERLQQLQHSFNSQEHQNLGIINNRQHSPPSLLSTITEDHDSADTILNVSQINITEEDDLEDSYLRSGRAYKRKSSSPDPHDKSANKRPSGTKSEGDKCSSEVKTEVTYYTEGEELKRVKVDIQPSRACFSVTAEDLVSPIKKLHRTPAPPPPTPANRNSNQSFFSPVVLGTPITPQSYITPNHTPVLRNYTSGSKVNGRPHSFVPKTAYTIERCQPCGKKIKFAKSCLKCRDCRAICHSECREMVPLPCVPTANTPSAKGQMGTIADYTPSLPPMVPAVVVHCTNDVENRGLTEVGIYRQCGSEREIKELKEQFLRGRGVPNLSQVDIHVVSGTLKYFLRSLKEPLVTNLLWKDFVTAAEKTEAQDSAASLYQAISELPQPNRDTLAWLICHLQRVAECLECKMPVMNLAKVFGPTVVGYSTVEPDPSTMVHETQQQHLVMEKLLEISPDYWQSFIQVADENTQPGNTPEVGGTMLGGMPRSSSRRRSQLFRTPLQTRDTSTLPYLRK